MVRDGPTQFDRLRAQPRSACAQSGGVVLTYRQPFQSVL